MKNKKKISWGFRWGVTQEAGGRRQEAGGRRQEAGGRRQDVASKFSWGNHKFLFRVQWNQRWPLSTHVKLTFSLASYTGMATLLLYCFMGSHSHCLEISPGGVARESSRKCPGQETQTFAFSRAAPLDKLRRISGDQCMSESSSRESYIMCAKASWLLIHPDNRLAFSISTHPSHHKRVFRWTEVERLACVWRPDKRWMGTVLKINRKAERPAFASPFFFCLKHPPTDCYLSSTRLVKPKKYRMGTMADENARQRVDRAHKSI